MTKKKRYSIKGQAISEAEELTRDKALPELLEIYNQERKQLIASRNVEDEYLLHLDRLDIVKSRIVYHIMSDNGYKIESIKGGFLQWVKDMEPVGVK